jgi:hypothetical protein
MTAQISVFVAPPDGVEDRFWAGPEVETSGDQVYRQYRIGAHVTFCSNGPRLNGRSAQVMLRTIAIALVFTDASAY